MARKEITPCVSRWCYSFVLPTFVQTAPEDQIQIKMTCLLIGFNKGRNKWNMDTVALVITGQLNWFFPLIRMWLPSEVGALIRIRDGYSFVGLPFDKQECIISSEGPRSPSSSPLSFTAADEKLAQKRALTHLSRGSSNHTHRCI